MRISSAPTLKAFVTADGISTRVWCAWCVAWHSHGHTDRNKPLGAGDGHRVAHCHDPDSPYEHTGYRLVEVGWWDDRPDWRHLPVVCRPCGQPFYRPRPQSRYCSDACRQQRRTAA